VPTYQYACTECGHNFDIVQSFSDDSLSVCPECGGRLRKVFNAVGVVFKGSGFYRTDSREAKTSGKSTSDGSSTSTGSGDSTSSTNGSSTSSDAPAKKSSPASPSKKNTESTKS
jgi:putative FmdB family regulatory protein